MICFGGGNDDGDGNHDDGYGNHDDDTDDDDNLIIEIEKYK